MSKHANTYLAAQAEAIGAPVPDEHRNTMTSVAALTAPGSLNEPQTQPKAIRTMSVPAAGKLYFGLSRNASYEAARRGDIPTIRVGRLLRAVPSVLERRLAEAGQTPLMPA